MKKNNLFLVSCFCIVGTLACSKSEMDVLNGEIESLRDPFFIQTKRKKNSTKLKLSLDGIVKTKGKIGAIIAVDGGSEFVFVADKVAGFFVQEINIDNVVLARGKKTLKLYIEE